MWGSRRPLRIDSATITLGSWRLLTRGDTPQPPVEYLALHDASTDEQAVQEQAPNPSRQRRQDLYKAAS